MKCGFFLAGLFFQLAGMAQATGKPVDVTIATERKIRQDVDKEGLQENDI